MRFHLNTPPYPHRIPTLPSACGCQLIYNSNRPTAAEPAAAVTRQSSRQHPAQNTGPGEEAGDGESEKKALFPPPIGPMVAVFLDEPSVEKLKAHFPEARDGQLRKVVLQYGPSASERQMYRHLFSRTAEVTVRRGPLLQYSSAGS